MRNPKMQEQYLELIDQVNRDGTYKPTWESLCRAQIPDWFDKRRLGIFIHWGVYSVPAYGNEWYPRTMYIQGTDEFDHHVKTYGSHSRFGYKDFIPLFRAEKFDPDEWIRLFQDAGAGYVFPVAEHHDGFQMYASELSEWNASDHGPGRNVLGELKEAAQRADMVFCASTHRAEHWFFMGNGKQFDSDVKEPLRQGDFYWPAMPEPELEQWDSEPYPTQDYLDDWLARTAELIVRYRPAMIYFDWWIQHKAFEPSLRKLAAFYYNMGLSWGQDVMICYKHDAMAFGSGIADVERGGFREPKPYRWQTDTAIANNSWCYTQSLEYKSAREIILTLIDTVSKNGNLLLNVGPKADGTIPDQDREILKQIGSWMKVNREAIDGAKPWRVSMEGTGNIEEGSFQEKQVEYTSSDFRFTCADGAVYAICLKCPEDGCFCIKSFAATPPGSAVGQYAAPFHGVIRDIQIPGYAGRLSWHADMDGLHVSAPELKSEYPVVIRIR
ncbi:MAG: alpha-L-fucosidase [Lachnospiraceae bacterium]|nr:alpha-L-fucosidase [Lachnospiraceae bacterium]